MSVFYCDHCDHLVDSDYAPEFEYNEIDQTWKCENCIENEGFITLLDNGDFFKGRELIENEGELK